VKDEIKQIAINIKNEHIMEYFKTTFFYLVFVLLGFHTLTAFAVGEPSYAALQTVDGVRNPVLLLDGEWQFRFEPKGKWYPVRVPGELVMQGFGIEHDKPYPCLPIIKANKSSCVLMAYIAMRVCG
jgi:hypothetical protein